MISKFLNQVTTLTHDILEELKSEQSSKADIESIKSSLSINKDDQIAVESKDLAEKAGTLLEELDTLKD